FLIIRGYWVNIRLRWLIALINPIGNVIATYLHHIYFEDFKRICLSATFLTAAHFMNGLILMMTAFCFHILYLK
ncbi:hypothetical protein L9F63_002489, partial [Diploptera punctata]